MGRWPLIRELIAVAEGERDWEAYAQTRRDGALQLGKDYDPSKDDPLDDGIARPTAEDIRRAAGILQRIETALLDPEPYRWDRIAQAADVLDDWTNDPAERAASTLKWLADSVSADRMTMDEAAESGARSLGVGAEYIRSALDAAGTTDDAKRLAYLAVHTGILGTPTVAADAPSDVFLEAVKKATSGFRAQIKRSRAAKT